MPDIKDILVGGVLYDIKDATAREQIGDLSALDTSAADLVSAINAAAKSGGGDSNVQRVESDTSNYVYLRDLASGIYILYGYFRPYSGAASRLVFDNVLVSVAADDTGSHILAFSTVNSKVDFITIEVDATQTSGFAYSRTSISLLNLHSLIEQVGSLDSLATTEKGSIVGAINEVAASAGSGDSSQTGNGLTQAQIDALNGMFKVCAYNKADVSAEYAAFKAAFGITEEEVHTHSYTSAVTTAATCTTAGVRTYTCACGASYTEAIPATGHSYVDGVCTVCGAADPNYNPDATLTSISATYSGGDVAVGTAVTDLTGIVVKAYYSGGAVETVTGYTLSGTIAEGSNTITVSYGGCTTTFTVTGIAEEEELEIIVPDVNNAFVTATFDVASTIVTNGVASGNASWEATDYIEIPAGYEYVMWRTANTAAYRGAFYDADQAYIRNITDATAIGAAKQVRDLIPDNAKYMRLSTGTSYGLDSVELSFGNNFVTGWSDTADHYVGSDGTITDGYTGTVQQRVTDGYIQLPDDAAMLIWGSRAGYTYRYMKIVVYDSDFNILTATAYDGTALFAATDASCVLDLTAVTGAAYIRCTAWDNGAAANDDPATQIVYGYCR